MTTLRGNRYASNQLRTTDPPPWRTWRTKSRHGRAIRFVETYCVPPKGYGAGRPLRLAPFQKHWLEEVLAGGVTSAAMSVPRGNGKSTFLAGVAAWALFDEDSSGAPQVPIVATTVNQAVRSVYGVACDMIAACDELFDRSLKYSATGSQRIFTPFNGGEMFPVSNEPDGLQGLDPSMAVCDEIGFMPLQSWDSLLLASGKRPHSLVAGIGTPGFDRSKSTLWHLRERVRSGVELPGFVFTEFAAPDDCRVDDEAMWKRANPALAAGYMNVDALRTAVALSPEGHFRIFRLGQWVDGVECWLGEDGERVWRGLEASWDGELGAATWVGVDVGLKHDSTAVVWCQVRPDGRMHVWAKIWLPVEGGRLDVADCMQFLRELAATYDVRWIAYDPRFFDLPAQQLDDEGLPMLEFPQSLERLSPAVGDVYERIMRGELAHNGDVGFAHQILNAVARFNDRGFVLAKSKSRDRIDAAVAMCMAVAVSSVAAPPPVAVPLGAWR
jgi:phage terminase large subunit-like protein